MNLKKLSKISDAVDEGNYIEAYADLVFDIIGGPKEEVLAATEDSSALDYTDSGIDNCDFIIYHYDESKAESWFYEASSIEDAEDQVRDLVDEYISRAQVEADEVSWSGGLMTSDKRKFQQNNRNEEFFYDAVQSMEQFCADKGFEIVSVSKKSNRTSAKVNFDIVVDAKLVPKEIVEYKNGDGHFDQDKANALTAYYDKMSKEFSDFSGYDDVLCVLRRGGDKSHLIWKFTIFNHFKR